MTRLDPSLFIQRLIVTFNGKHVVDILFHDGLNIISGANGSGKSTIADFVYYALGGEEAQFKPEAAKCDQVFLQVECSGKVATLRREVVDSARQGVSIAWSSFESIKPSDWLLFPFSGTESKESFSQVLFRSMGLPEVKGTLKSRLTMHQLLRLVYVDQRTPYDSIFRTDRFDTSSLREAVGQFLSGFYDDNIYELQIELRDLETKQKVLEQQLKSLDNILIQTGEILTIPGIEETIANTKKDRDEKIATLKTLQEEGWKQSAAASATKEANEIAALRSELAAVSRDLTQKAMQIRSLRLDREDSEQFLQSLEHRLAALDDAAKVKLALGEIPFSVCPACYAELKHRSNGGCPLCQAPNSAKSEGGHKGRLEQELALQVRESRELQDDRERRLATLDVERADLDKRRLQLSTRFNTLTADIRPPVNKAIDDLQREVGYITRKIEDLEQRRKVAEAFDRIRKELAEIAGKRTTTQQDLAAREHALASRTKVIVESIAAQTVSLLRQDLPSEEFFVAAEIVTFNFGDDRVRVGGRSIFSASSNVILKNSLHVAIFLASCRIPEMRYPRFLLMDNVEDKGMQEIRSHRFQEVVAAEMAKLTSRSQLIMTTSAISDKLDNDQYVVGNRLTPDNKAIQF